jgi:hypothetical protein
MRFVFWFRRGVHWSVPNTRPCGFISVSICTLQWFFCQFILKFRILLMEPRPTHMDDDLQSFNFCRICVIKWRSKTCPFHGNGTRLNSSIYFIDFINGFLYHSLE